jgi:hypothetical protein
MSISYSGDHRVIDGATMVCSSPRRPRPQSEYVHACAPHKKLRWYRFSSQFCVVLCCVVCVCVCGFCCCCCCVCPGQLLQRLQAILGKPIGHVGRVALSERVSVHVLLGRVTCAPLLFLSGHAHSIITAPVDGPGMRICQSLLHHFVAVMGDQPAAPECVVVFVLLFCCFLHGCRC